MIILNILFLKSFVFHKMNVRFIHFNEFFKIFFNSYPIFSCLISAAVVAGSNPIMPGGGTVVGAGVGVATPISKIKVSLLGT